MTHRLIIFGLGDIAQLAHYYFSSDSHYEVVAFVVDAEYRKENFFCGLPVVAFEEVALIYSPNSYDIFIALSYSNLNSVRKSKYFAAKALGYKIASYISPKATILNNGDIGENCFILEDNTIQPFVSIGNNVTLWSGNHIGHHSIVGDHCFISSHVVISGGVEIGEQCFFGVNSTVRDHLKIGDRCIIGAGALLLSSADADGIYIGTPSQRSRVPSSRFKAV